MVISESGAEGCSFTAVHNEPSLAMQNSTGDMGLVGRWWWFAESFSAQTFALNMDFFGEEQFGNNLTQTYDSTG